MQADTIRFEREMAEMRSASLQVHCASVRGEARAAWADRVEVEAAASEAAFPETAASVEVFQAEVAALAVLAAGIPEASEVRPLEVGGRTGRTIIMTAIF